jgi:hypothetical protein
MPKWSILKYIYSHLENLTMAYRTIPSSKIQGKALLVCAGTVTCETVAGMAAGFSLFKREFRGATPYNEGYTTWEAALQKAIDEFRGQENSEPMPAYLPVAKKGELIGGVATVPYYGTKKIGLAPSIETPTDDQLKEQYKEAIRGALAHAKELDCPLIIQPLGIGVYGWEPRVAAQLMHEVINEVDADHSLNVSILIYDPRPNSNDIQFQNELKTLMGEKLEVPIEAQKLSVVIDTLIGNITSCKYRNTSGTDSDKVKQLIALKGKITNSDPQSILEYIQAIRRVCEQKRHWWNFWTSPKSVNEFDLLLKSNDLAQQDQVPGQDHECL